MHHCILQGPLNTLAQKYNFFPKGILHSVALPNHLTSKVNVHRPNHLTISEGEDHQRAKTSQM